MFPAYIYLLTNGSNTKVGVAVALQGSAQALAAIPVGLLVDKKSVPRQTVLRLLGVLGLVCTALYMFAVWREDYLLVCASLCVAGLWNASQIPVDAVFADSVDTGRRYPSPPPPGLFRRTGKSRGEEA